MRVRLIDVAAGILLVTVVIAVAVVGVQRRRITYLEEIIAAEHYAIPSNCPEENLLIGRGDYKEGRYKYYECYVVAPEPE